MTDGSHGLGAEGAATRVDDGVSTAIADAPAELLSEILHLAPIGVGIVDEDGRTVLTNDALRTMLGYSEQEFAELPFAAFTHVDDIARNEELFDQLMSGEIERFDLDKRFIHRDGHIVWGRLLVARITSSDGSPLAVGLLQDVTEEKRLQAELEAAEAQYRLIVEQVPAVVYAGPVAPEEPATYISPRVEDLLGFTPQEWSTTTGLWLSHLHPDDRAWVPARLDAHVRSGSREPLTMTYRMHRRDGSLIWLRDQVSVVEEEDGERYQRGVLVDVTREKQLEEELEQQAFHDPLTHLANLRLFRIRIADRLARRPPLAGAVVFLDLDEFKTVNDALGHAAGDELLVEAARRIRACLRSADTASRLGGDEFAILLDEVRGQAQAVAIAERVLARLGEPFRLGPDLAEVSSGASLGVAMLADGGTADAVLRAADLAMYAAKAAGKRQVRVFEPELLSAAVGRLERG
ncbi:MAG: diguanylate cyclase [Nitriliruptoraceae bacterium]